LWQRRAAAGLSACDGARISCEHAHGFLAENPGARQLLAERSN